MDKQTREEITCLSGVKVVGVAHHLESLVDSAGEESVVVGHIDTTDMGKPSHQVPGAKFRLLVRML